MKSQLLLLTLALVACDQTVETKTSGTTDPTIEFVQPPPGVDTGFPDLNSDADTDADTDSDTDTDTDTDSDTDTDTGDTAGDTGMVMTGDTGMMMTGDTGMVTATGDTGTVTPTGDTGAGDTGPFTTFAAVNTIFAAKCADCHTVDNFGGHNMGGADVTSAYNDSQLSASIATCATLTKGECAQVRILSGAMPQSAGCTGDPTVDDPTDCLTQAELDTLADWIADGQQQ